MKTPSYKRNVELTLYVRSLSALLSLWIKERFGAYMVCYLTGLPELLSVERATAHSVIGALWGSGQERGGLREEARVLTLQLYRLKERKRRSDDEAKAKFKATFSAKKNVLSANFLPI